MTEIPLITVGYEGMTTGEFVRTLRRSKVQTVIDVRFMPLSRKKGFSKTALASLLAENGIAYTSMRTLGTPPNMRKRYKETGDYHWLAVHYLRYLQDQENAVAELYRLAVAGGCCLLCYEHEPGTCHRAILAQELTRRNGHRFRIQHI